MKIFNITNSRISNCRLFSVFRRKSVAQNLAADTFERRAKLPEIFQEIKFKSAEKIYKTKFTPSDNDYGKFTYKSFVLDKKTDTPVEIFFQPKIMSGNIEEYYIFEPETMDVLGMCKLEFDETKDLMEIAYMLSRGKDKYSGIGTRIYQLAFELKNMRNIKNIQIVSEPKAYFFHEKAGFKPIKCIETIDSEKYHNIISSFSRDYGISEKNLKKLIITQDKGDEILWDKYSSYVNILKYLKSHADEKTLNSSNLFVVMEPNVSAIEDWEKLAQKHPIFLGKEFPQKL